MAWEKRKGHCYYYCSSRRNGRVVKQYVGRGPAAEFAAEAVALRQEARRRERRFRQSLDRSLKQLDQQMDTLASGCRQLMAAELYATGYHKNRSQWRKRR